MTRIARWVIGGMCAVVLVSGSTRAWRSARDGVRVASTATPSNPDQWDKDRLYDAQFECIRDQINRQVPAGSVIYIGDQPDSPDPVWQQRLAELSFRRAMIVDSAERATLVLKVIGVTETTTASAGATAEPSCYGVRLDVRAR